MSTIAVIGGFGNATLVMTQGCTPKDFNLSRYRDALLQVEPAENRKSRWNEEWQPGIGEFLGPQHYRQAICNLEDRYQQTVQGNEERLGKLVTFLNREFNNLNMHYASAAIIDLEGLDKECCILTIQEEVQRENILKMVSFLSLWAYVCRKNTRNSQILENFMADIKMRLNQMGMSSQRKGMLAYLLYVGEDVFAFYLLLWEFIFTCEIDLGEKGHA